MSWSADISARGRSMPTGAARGMSRLERVDRLTPPPPPLVLSPFSYVTSPPTHRRLGQPIRWAPSSPERKKIRCLRRDAKNAGKVKCGRPLRRSHFFLSFSLDHTAEASSDERETHPELHHAPPPVFLCPLFSTAEDIAAF